MDYKIITSDDGSSTLFHKQLNETYHSTRGAKSESIHVYIKNGIDLIKEKFSKLHILEVGFGTGLNAILSYQKSNNEQLIIDYKSLEPYPLSAQIYESLNFGLSKKDETILKQFHEQKSHETHTFSDNFTFTKYHISIEKLTSSQKFNLVYFDAFAPSAQPEIWDLEIFEKLHSLMVKDAVLTTYCAAGHFKRKLKVAGFIVLNPIGALGKKEMTVAIKS